MFANQIERKRVERQTAGVDCRAVTAGTVGIEQRARLRGPAFFLAQHRGRDERHGEGDTENALHDGLTRAQEMIAPAGAKGG
jgi:hypothetical protein